VVALQDPDSRTAGAGIARLKAAGVSVGENILHSEAASELAGFTGRLARGRPELALKLALSLDGRLAMQDGTSQWITGEPARHFAHILRAEADLILVGGGTLRADAPSLTIRLPGCAAPGPLRAVLTSGPVPEGWLAFAGIEALDREASRLGVNRILCEGGGQLASTLLAADRVDRLILLRAPILIGSGIGLEGLRPESLAATHGRWSLADRRALGSDLLEIYSRAG
jgi:diaminohydroxyphosphoribosylaminopyrimidine deaminase/5-amino-6-(5-phosphoribosylamino)uracil reductase